MEYAGRDELFGADGLGAGRLTLREGRGAGFGAGRGAGRLTRDGVGFGVGRLTLRDGVGLGAGFVDRRTESKYCCFVVVGRLPCVGLVTVGRDVGAGFVLRMILGLRLVEGFAIGLGVGFAIGLGVGLAIGRGVGLAAGVEERVVGREFRAASTRALTASRYCCFVVVGTERVDGARVDGARVDGARVDGLTILAVGGLVLEAVDGLVLRMILGEGCEDGFGVVLSAGLDGLVVAARWLRVASTRALTLSKYCCLEVVSFVVGFVFDGVVGLAFRTMLGEFATPLVLDFRVADGLPSFRARSRSRSRARALAFRFASTRALTESRYSCLVVVGRVPVGGLFVEPTTRPFPG